MYRKTRERGFGPEVKRRIMRSALYALSAWLLRRLLPARPKSPRAHRPRLRRRLSEGRSHRHTNRSHALHFDSAKSLPTPCKCIWQISTRLPVLLPGCQEYPFLAARLKPDCRLECRSSVLISVKATSFELLARSKKPAAFPCNAKLGRTFRQPTFVYAGRNHPLKLQKRSTDGLHAFRSEPKIMHFSVKSRFSPFSDPSD